MNTLKLSGFRSSFLWLYVLSLGVFCSCNNAQETKIVNQTWMTENLNVDHFRNGDSIPEAKSFDEWRNFVLEEKPAFCYVRFDPSYGQQYGKLYNRYAVLDERGLAPAGWKIPAKEDWKQLESNISKEYQAYEVASKIKAPEGWDHLPGASSTPSTNETDFNALPGSYISVKKPDEYGNWIGVDLFSEDYFQNSYSANWWVSDGKATFGLNHNKDNLSWGGAPYSEGHYVRCLKE
jgi:uncharacterized protein (TIGR02145 family)